MPNLKGLVYGLTEIPHEDGVAGIKRPVPLALVVGVAFVLLEFLVLVESRHARSANTIRIFFLMLGVILTAWTRFAGARRR